MMGRGKVQEGRNYSREPQHPVMKITIDRIDQQARPGCAGGQERRDRKRRWRHEGAEQGQQRPQWWSAPETKPPPGPQRQATAYMDRVLARASTESSDAETDPLPPTAGTSSLNRPLSLPNHAAEAARGGETGSARGLGSPGARCAGRCTVMRISRKACIERRCQLDGAVPGQGNEVCTENCRKSWSNELRTVVVFEGAGDDLRRRLPIHR